jgi:hypothetical protein
LEGQIVFRSIFRFSIRDVFWLTLVVGLALGWFVHYRAMQSRYTRRSDYILLLKDELRWSIGTSDALKVALQKGVMIHQLNYGPGELPPELENENESPPGGKQSN